MAGESGQPVCLKWRQPGVNGAAPVPRGGHAMAAVDRTLYFFGGADRGATCFDDLHSFSIDKVEFSKISTSGEKPCARSGATLSAVGNKLYLFGGRESQMKEDAEFFNDMYVLDTVTCVWTKVVSTGPTPEARNSHTAVVCNKKIYTFGGGNAAGPLGDLVVFDTESKSWTVFKFDAGVGPEAREMHGSALINGKVVVIGGRGFDKFLNDFWFFDTESSMWGKSHVAPFTRAGVTASQLEAPTGEKFICVFGGVSESGVHQDIDLYDLDNGKWFKSKPEGTQPATRFGHTQLTVEQSIYVFGGVNIEGDHNDLFVLERAVDDLD